MSMWRLVFWRAAGERGLRAAAASLSSLLVADGTGILTTAWTDRLSVAAMAGLVSLLLSVAAGAADPSTGPSFGSEVTPGADYAGEHVGPG